MSTSAPIAKSKSSSSTSKGSSSTPLPISRVNKIIKADKDVRLCSKEAIFLISRATEHFLNRLMKQAQTQARLQKREKTIKYSDMSKAVVARPEWFFLTEVVPPTLPLSLALAKRTAAGIPGSIPTEDENHPYHPSTSNGMEGVGGLIETGGGIKKRRPAANKAKVAAAAAAAAAAATSAGSGRTAGGTATPTAGPSNRMGRPPKAEAKADAARQPVVERRDKMDVDA